MVGPTLRPGVPRSLFRSQMLSHLVPTLRLHG